MSYKGGQEMRPVIGFVGLGNMGAPMVANLCAAGFEVWVHDLSHEVQARVAAETASHVTPNPGRLAEVADVLILMLPNGAIVREFLCGSSNGAAPVDRLRFGSVVVDMGSSAPAGTRTLGKILAERGVALVDAPVSGGVAKARTGKLAMMTGGDTTTIAAVEPVLAAMASSIMHVGPLGAGHAMKALNNYVSAAGLTAACEAVAVASHFGIEPEMALQVLNASTGRNNSTETKLGPFILSQAFNSGFSLGLMRKDLATALELAREVGVEPDLMDDLADLWGRAEKRLGSSSDHTEIAKMSLTP